MEASGTEVIEPETPEAPSSKPIDTHGQGHIRQVRESMGGSIIGEVNNIAESSGVT